MAKLYFRYGTVSSSKSANLLMVYHNYKNGGKNALLIKPSIDDRKGENIVYSRVGINKEADIILKENDSIFDSLTKRSYTDLSNIHCIICDEAQFFTENQIKELRSLATFQNVPVICYGLKTDFRGLLFKGSYTLLCLADSIEEIKTICYFCNKKAIMNTKIDKDGKKIYEGNDQPDVGFEDKYLPTCFYHYIQ